MVNITREMSLSPSRIVQSAVPIVSLDKTNPNNQPGMEVTRVSDIHHTQFGEILSIIITR